MHWNADGKIEVSRNFAVGLAVTVIALVLTAIFLIGMVVSGNENGTLGAERLDDAVNTVTIAQTGSKIDYSTCLARTWRALNLDVKGTEFTPWEERNTTKDAWPLIELRHIEYIGDHCRDLAPPPPESSSATCIPRELQIFYRRHIAVNADTKSHQAIAAEYALTVCHPRADR